MTKRVGRLRSLVGILTVVAAMAGIFVVAPQALGDEETPSPPQITTQPTDKTLHPGEEAVFYFQFTGEPYPSYQWEVQRGGTGPWLPIESASGHILRVFANHDFDGNRYRVTLTNELGTVTSDVVTLHVIPSPQMAVQPTDTQAAAGTTTRFSSTAYGQVGEAVPQAQWQRSDDGGSSWAPVEGTSTHDPASGMVTAHLDVPVTFDDDGARFRVVFSNEHGTVTSRAATLSVYEGIAITEQPVDQWVTSATDPVTFSIGVSGDPAPTVTWEYQIGQGSTWWTAGTGTTLSVPGSADNLENTYRAVVRATNTTDVLVSDLVRIRVGTAPSITQAPRPFGIAEGEQVDATFTVAVAGTPTPTVQWQRALGEGEEWHDLAGETGLTLTVPAEAGRWYRAVATNALGTSASAGAYIEEVPRPVITEHPQSSVSFPPLYHCFALDVAERRVGIDWVRWEVRVGGLGEWTAVQEVPVLDDSPILGCLTFEAASTQVRAVYTRHGRISVTSNPAWFILANSAPVVVTDPPPRVAVDLDETDQVSLVTAGGAFPLPTVQWQRRSAGSWTDVPGADTPTLTLTGLTEADHGATYRAVYTNVHGSDASDAVTVVVGRRPTITAQPVSVSADEGQQVTFTVGVEGFPEPFIRWQRGTGSWGMWQWETLPSGAAFGDTFTFNASEADQGVWYRAHIDNEIGGAVFSRPVRVVFPDEGLTIVEHPTDTVVDLRDGVAPARFTAAVLGGTGPVSVQWQARSLDAPWADIEGATSTTLELPVVPEQFRELEVRAVFSDDDIVVATDPARFRQWKSPRIVQQPETQVAELGTTVEFTIGVDSIPPAAVSWEREQLGEWEFVWLGATMPRFVGILELGVPLRARVSVLDETLYSDVVTVLAPAAPEITHHPGNQLVDLAQGDGRVTLTAAATGAPAPTVQWERSTDNGSTWTPIEGATSPTLELTLGLADGGHRIRALFSNPYGRTYTLDARMTVIQSPVITQQPEDVHAGPGDVVVFSVIATAVPGPISYAWEVYREDGKGWETLPLEVGSASPTLSLPYDTFRPWQVRVHLIPLLGSPVTSRVATVHPPTLPVVTEHPEDVHGEVGEEVALTAAAAAQPDPQVRWQRLDPDAGWVDVAGETAPTLVLTLSEADRDAEYRAVFRNSGGVDVASNVARIFLPPDPSSELPVITQEPQDALVDLNVTGSARFAAASDDPEATVVWERSTDGGSTWHLIPDGPTSTVLELVVAVPDDGHRYRAVFTNAAGSTRTRAAVLRLYGAPNIVQQPTDQTGEVGEAVTFTVLATGWPDPTIRWERAVTGSGEWAAIDGATSSSLTFTVAEADRGHDYRAVVSNEHGQVVSNVAHLTVPMPPTSTDPTDASVTYGEEATFSIAVDGDPLPTVTWQRWDDDGGDWVDIPGATSTTYALRPSVADSGMQVRAVVDNGLSSPVVTAAATLTVAKAPLTISAVDQTITYGEIPAPPTWQATGFVDGDDEHVLTSAPTCADAAGLDLDAGLYSIYCSGAAAENYDITYDVGTLTIAKAALTITADDAQITYGDALPALTWSAEGFVAGQGVEVLTALPTCTVGPVAEPAPAGAHTVACAGGSAANYELTYVDGTLTVAKAALTITADDAQITYGDALPALTWTAEGFVVGDGVEVLTTPPTCTVAAAQPGAGTHAVTCTGAAAANYDITYAAGTLTVAKKVLTLVVDPQTRPYGAANPELTWSLEGFVAGDTAESAVTGAATCSTTATEASAASRTYPITCTPGSLTSANYEVVDGQSILSVHKATTTVTVSSGRDGFRVATIVTARVTRDHDGAPIAGRTVVITLNDQELCRGVTDADGALSCPAKGLALQMFPDLVAAWTGDANHLSSRATA